MQPPRSVSARHSGFSGCQHSSKHLSHRATPAIGRRGGRQLAAHRPCGGRGACVRVGCCCTPTGTFWGDIGLTGHPCFPCCPTAAGPSHFPGRGMAPCHRFVHGDEQQPRQGRERRRASAWQQREHAPAPSLLAEQAQAETRGGGAGRGPVQGERVPRGEGGVGRGPAPAAPRHHGAPGLRHLSGKPGGHPCPGAMRPPLLRGVPRRPVSQLQGPAPVPYLPDAMHRAAGEAKGHRRRAGPAGSAGVTQDQDHARGEAGGLEGPRRRAGARADAGAAPQGRQADGPSRAAPDAGPARTVGPPPRRHPRRLPHHGGARRTIRTAGRPGGPESQDRRRAARHQRPRLLRPGRDEGALRGLQRAAARGGAVPCAGPRRPGPRRRGAAMVPPRLCPRPRQGPGRAARHLQPGPRVEVRPRGAAPVVGGHRRGSSRRSGPLKVLRCITIHLQTGPT
uniref:Uncharacterized protein n=1 Tax=Auxenochlorella protothecoides TaxID=3075 RepID=A0A1D2AAK1_AUXPR